jgi:hypothetical protein
MSDIETQYNFDQNTIVIHIQLLPKTDANQPRTAVVGVGIKNSPPIITKTNVEQLELPAQINSMLSKLSAELPQRKAAALELMEKQQQTKLISTNSSSYVTKLLNQYVISMKLSVLSTTVQVVFGLMKLGNLLSILSGHNLIFLS